MNKKRKIIISLIIIGVVILGISFTLTYFRSNFSTSKKLATDIFRATYTSTLEQPDTWVPGSSTTGNFKVKNETNLSVAVRAKIEEHWYDANGNLLSNQLNNQDVAVKTIGTGWGLYDGYYYYNKTLDTQNEETSNLIPNIEFADLFSGTDCVSNGNGTKTCAYGGGYSTGKYSLVVTFEVIQADAYETEWQANLVNAEYKMRAYFNVGAGESVNVSQKGIELNKQVGDLPTAIKPNHSFVGWFTAAQGGTEVTPTTVASTLKDMQLYAHFTPNKYIVTFNSGTGFTQPSNIEVPYNGSESFDLTLANNYKLSSISCGEGYTPTYTANATGTTSVTIANSNTTVGTSCTITAAVMVNSNILAVKTYDETTTGNAAPNNYKCVSGNESTCVVSNCMESKTAGSCPVGTIVDFKVNSNTTVRFHVLQDNGNTVLMQSQENTVKGVAWYASSNSNASGPTTIVPELETATSGWTNVNILNTTYPSATAKCSSGTPFTCTTGYPNYSTGNANRARLITVLEATDTNIGNCTTSNNSCRKFMNNFLYQSTSYGGTNDDTGTTYGPTGDRSNYGYWTSSAYASFSTDAWHVRRYGFVGNFSTSGTYDGARAVVEINK